ncbi:MAG: hypothetical protein R2747_21060 [Pyrinomonadaceae bacterium]
MSSKAFQTDLKRGQVAEKLLFEIFKSWDWKPELAEGYFPDWDIRVKSGKTVEVKWDVMAQKTGNICLELEALNHSKADVLAVAYGRPIKAFYLLEMDKARKFAKGWGNKKKVGEFKVESALIKRTLFLELLKPKIIDLQTK